MAYKTGALATKDLERVAVDTTVQPKAVAFPTDARLPRGQEARCPAPAALCPGRKAGRLDGQAPGSASAAGSSTACMRPRSSASATARPAHPMSSAAKSPWRPRSPNPRAASLCSMPRRCTAIHTTATHSAPSQCAGRAFVIDIPPPAAAKSASTRRSWAKSLEELLPRLYLKGISTSICSTATAASGSLETCRQPKA